MPVTCLDARTALIIIDLQKGIAQMAGRDRIAPVVHNARLLAETFRERSLPVVLVTVAGSAPGRTEQPRPSQPSPPDWTELLPELQPTSDDICITKRTWGAFASTDLEQQLRDRDVTQIVVAGVATSIGVESTARQGYEAGFNVTLAVDAMTDLRDEAHQCSIAHIFPRLGETGTTAEIIALLEQA